MLNVWKQYYTILNPGFGNPFFKLVLIQDYLLVRVPDLDSSWSAPGGTRRRISRPGEAANQYFSQNKKKVKSFTENKYEQLLIGDDDLGDLHIEIIFLNIILNQIWDEKWLLKSVWTFYNHDTSNY